MYWQQINSRLCSLQCLSSRHRKLFHRFIPSRSPANSCQWRTLYCSADNLFTAYPSSDFRCSDKCRNRSYFSVPQSTQTWDSSLKIFKFPMWSPVCQHSVSYGFEGQWPLRIMLSTKSLAQSVGIYWRCNHCDVMMVAYAFTPLFMINGILAKKWFFIAIAHASVYI